MDSAISHIELVHIALDRMLNLRLGRDGLPVGTCNNSDEQARVKLTNLQDKTNSKTERDKTGMRLILALLAAGTHFELSPCGGQVNNGRTTVTVTAPATHGLQVPTRHARSLCLAYRCYHLRFSVFLGSLMTIRPCAWYSTCYGAARHWGRGRVITSKLRPNRGPTQAGQMRRARSRQRLDGALLLPFFFHSLSFSSWGPVVHA